MNKMKLINDPVYGLIHIRTPLIFDLIEHPLFQRLRRIKQTGPTHLVYPGSQHTRFHHALGAMHLMGMAIDELRSKQTDISEKEEDNSVKKRMREMGFPTEFKSKWQVNLCKRIKRS